MSTTANTPLKLVLYARKSSDSEDRQVLSIDSQLNELKSLGEREGHRIVAVKTESRSAKEPGRPVFDEVLNMLRHREADGILTWMSDRLSRNSVDTGNLIYLFDQGSCQAVVTPTQIFKNTPTDKFMLTLFCTQAKLDNDTKGVNVKRGLKTKAERGMYPAPAPLGYMNDPLGQKGLKSITPDPARFPVVRRLFDSMLTGSYTVPALLKLANDSWGFTALCERRLARTTLYYTLTNPFYAGTFEYPKGSGNWYQGKHEPMITLQEYDRIQALLGRKGRPRPKSHVFDFAGLLRCGECGGSVTAEERIKNQKNGNIHRYVYYHCTKKVVPTCTQGALEETVLKADALAAIDTFELPPEFHAFAMKWFRKEHGKEVATRTVVLRKQRQAHDDCVRKLDGLTDMRAAREITDEEFARRRSTLLQEKLRLDEQLAGTSRRPEAWLEAADRLFTFVEDAREKFLRGNGIDRRQILSEIGSNLLAKDRKLVVEPEKTFVALRRAAREGRRAHARLEPVKSGSGKIKTEQVYAQFPAVLRALADVRTCLQSAGNRPL